jgi:hypothetical protein
MYFFAFVDGVRRYCGGPKAHFCGAGKKPAR